MRRLFRGELSDLLLFDGPWLLRLRSTYLRFERVFQRDVEKSKVKAEVERATLCVEPTTLDACFLGGRSRARYFLNYLKQTSET